MAPCGGTVAAPALLFAPPALLEFAIRLILDMPAGPMGLESSKAIGPGARADQAAGQGHAGQGVLLADQTGPQRGAGAPWPAAPPRSRPNWSGRRWRPPPPCAAAGAP